MRERGQKADQEEKILENKEIQNLELKKSISSQESEINFGSLYGQIQNSEKKLTG